MRFLPIDLPGDLARTTIVRIRPVFKTCQTNGKLPAVTRGAWDNGIHTESVINRARALEHVRWQLRQRRDALLHRTSSERVRARLGGIEIRPIPGVVVVQIIVHERRELRALRDDLYNGDIFVLLCLEDIDLGRATAPRNSRSGVVPTRAGACTKRINLRNKRQFISRIRTIPAAHSANSIRSCSQSATCPSAAPLRDPSHPCKSD